MDGERILNMKGLIRQRLRVWGQGRVSKTEGCLKKPDGSLLYGNSI